MSKPSRLSREARKLGWKDLKKARCREQAEPPSFALPNRKSDLKTVSEEKEAVQTLTEESLKVYRQLLPGLLQKLSRIPDPRSPKKIKHQMTMMMLYGILMFVFQGGSRRKTNQKMTAPQLLENLRAVFPEVMDFPHQDTLCRLLEAIDVDQIEALYIDMLRRLIRKKKFMNLLHKKRYLVAIDGTQKYVMCECWDERYLCRKRGKEGEYQYYAYVLEAVLIFSNGMVLPLMSEFLENTTELERIESDEQWKQDSELKAFYRLAKRLKSEFPKLKLTLLLDGLYANGPVMETCLKNNWKFMIVLKDKSLPAVWQEVNGLIRLDTAEEHCHKRTWRRRKQTFRWANGIEYDYGLGKRKKTLNIHVVTCEESWEEIDKNGSPVVKPARHAWVVSDPLNRSNVHEQCNLAARKRWVHENNILKEKHQGYYYEHIFSHDWNAMRGYHYLMHIARMLNEMALHSISLIEHVKTVGIRSFIKNFCETMANRELDTNRLRRLSEHPGQLRLVHEEDWKTNRSAA